MPGTEIVLPNYIRHRGRPGRLVMVDCASVGEDQEPYSLIEFETGVIQNQKIHQVLIKTSDLKRNTIHNCPSCECEKPGKTLEELEETEDNGDDEDDEDLIP